MLSVTKQSTSILNRLMADLPEGLIIDSAWLADRGVSSGLRAYYVKSGWLEQPVRGVYRRPRGPLSWEQVVISLQTILGGKPLVVGGRTALALEGFEHYLPAQHFRMMYIFRCGSGKTTFFCLRKGQLCEKDLFQMPPDQSGICFLQAKDERFENMGTHEPFFSIELHLLR